jgi:hypothetical protein
LLSELYYNAIFLSLSTLFLSFFAGGEAVRSRGWGLPCRILDWVQIERVLKIRSEHR